MPSITLGRFLFVPAVLTPPYDDILLPLSLLSVSSTSNGGDVGDGRGASVTTQTARVVLGNPDTSLKGAELSNNVPRPTATISGMSGGTTENVQDGAASRHREQDQGSAQSSSPSQVTPMRNDQGSKSIIASETEVPNKNQEQTMSETSRQDNSSQGLYITSTHADTAQNTPLDDVLFGTSLSASSPSNPPSSFIFGLDPGQVNPNHLIPDQLSELSQALSPTLSESTATRPSLGPANSDSASPHASEEVANTSSNLVPAYVGLRPGEMFASLPSSPSSGIFQSNPNGDARSRPEYLSPDSGLGYIAGSLSSDLVLASELSGPGYDYIRGASSGDVVFGSLTLQPGSQMTSGGPMISIGSAVVFADSPPYTYSGSNRPQLAQETITALQIANDLAPGAASQEGGQATFPLGAEGGKSGGRVSAIGSANTHVDASLITSIVAGLSSPIQTGTPAMYEAADGGLVLGSMTIPPGVQATSQGHTLSIGSDVVAVDGGIYTWSEGTFPLQVVPSEPFSGASGTLASFGRSDASLRGQATTLQRSFIDQAGSMTVLEEVSSAAPTQQNDTILGVITSVFGDGLAATTTEGGIVMQPGSAPTAGNVLPVYHTVKPNSAAHKPQTLSRHQLLPVAIGVSIQYMLM